MLRQLVIPSCLVFTCAALGAQDTVAHVVDGLLVQHERESAARSDAAFAVAQERQQLAADLDQAYLDLGDAYRRLEVMAGTQGKLKSDLERSRIDANDAPRLRDELVRVRDQVAAIRQRIREATQALAPASSTPAPAGAMQAPGQAVAPAAEAGCATGQCPVSEPLPVPATATSPMAPASTAPAAETPVTGQETAPAKP